MTSRDEQVQAVEHQQWTHPEGGCAGDCSPGSFPGGAAGDLVHEDMRVQGCTADPATLVHYGVRRWDTVDPGGQSTHPAQFLMETTGEVEWELGEARQFLEGALERVAIAEAAETCRPERYETPSVASSSSVSDSD